MDENNNNQNTDTTSGDVKSNEKTFPYEYVSKLTREAESYRKKLTSKEEEFTKALAEKETKLKDLETKLTTLEEASKKNELKALLADKVTDVELALEVSNKPDFLTDNKFDVEKFLTKYPSLKKVETKQVNNDVQNGKTSTGIVEGSVEYFKKLKEDRYKAK